MASDGGSFICIFIVSLFIVGYGFLMLVARDLMWSWTESTNARKGVTSERTEAWEGSQTISGVILILAGTGLLCFSISTLNQQNQQQAQADARETAIAATDSANIPLLESTLREYLPRWQKDETEGVHYADIPGIQAQHIYYGWCNGNAFYVYIENFPSGSDDDFAYLTDSSPDYCRPSGLRFNFMRDSRSIGGKWYSVSLEDSSLDKVITPTPSPTRATAMANPTQIQQTIDAAIQTQLTAAAGEQHLPITQTIGAAVQATLSAATEQANSQTAIP